jgi:hypothetical protein
MVNRLPTEAYFANGANRDTAQELKSKIEIEDKFNDNCDVHYPTSANDGRYGAPSMHYFLNAKDWCCGTTALEF